MPIEAGIMGKNTSLAAAGGNLTTTPTAALSDSRAHSPPQLDWIWQSPIRGVLARKPLPRVAGGQNFIPNPLPEA
jgi:hypothetical protein